MACKYICDGCGKEVPSDNMPHGHFKPRSWFQRGDAEHKTQDACSRECIEKIAKKTGASPLVLPI